MNTNELGRISSAPTRASRRRRSQREGRSLGHPRRRCHAPRGRARRRCSRRCPARAAAAQFRPRRPRQTRRDRDWRRQPRDDRHRSDCAYRNVRLSRRGRPRHRHCRGPCGQAGVRARPRRAVGRPSQRRDGPALRFLSLSRTRGAARRRRRPKSTPSAPILPRSGRRSSGSTTSTPMRRMRAG